MSLGRVRRWDEDLLELRFRVRVELELLQRLVALEGARRGLEATQIGEATDPVFWVPLNHTSSWLFNSF